MLTQVACVRVSVARSRYYENIARSKKIMCDSEFTKSWNKFLLEIFRVGS